MRATVKGKYDADKSSAAASLGLSGGDFKLRASMTDATVVNGPSLNGLAISLEKPGAFIVDYNVPKKDFRFQFMNTIRVADKPVHLTYVHMLGDERTTLDGTLVFNSANKVSVNYAFGSGNCKAKYIFVHGAPARRTFEPCYDFSKNAWDFAISQKVFEDDVLRASYHTSSKVLGLDWTRSTKNAGSFKISTSLDLSATDLKAPKIIAESRWNFDL